MPIQVATPPANALALVASSVQRTFGFGGGGQALAVPDPSQLNAALGQPVYNLTGDQITANAAMSSATLVAWLFLIFDGQTAIASVELVCNPDGSNLRLGGVNAGPYVNGILSAVQYAETLPAVQTGTYELRLIQSPSVFATAIWLKDLVGTNDLIIQIRASASVPGGNTLGSISGGGGGAVLNPVTDSQAYIGSLLNSAQQAQQFNTDPATDPLGGNMPEPQPPPPPPVPIPGSSPTPVTPTPVTPTPVTPTPVTPTPVTPTPVTPTPVTPTPVTPTPVTPTSASVAIDRQGFIQAYAALTILNWTDPTFMAKLLTDPAGVLAANGIRTTDGAVIRVIQMEITGMGHIEEQVDYWVKGIETGLFDLFIPALPAGASLQPGGAGGGDACCCCCPCCSCT